MLTAICSILHKIFLFILLTSLLVSNNLILAANFTDADASSVPIVFSAPIDDLTISSSETVFTSTDAIATVYIDGNSGDVDITNNGTIRSTGGSNVAIDYVSGALSSLDITNNASGTISGSTFAIDLDSATISAIVTNAGTITGPVRLSSNNDALRINGNGSISGNITGNNSNTLAVGFASTASNFTPGGTISGIGSITLSNSSTMTTTKAISGVNTGLTVNNGSTLTLGSTFDGTGTFTNNGTMTINAAVGSSAGGGRIRNGVANAATMTINAPVTATGGTFDNANASTLTINADITITANSFTSATNCTVIVKGNRTLDATGYNNDRDHQTTITNSSTFDSLTCLNGAINMGNPTSRLFVTRVGNDYIPTKNFSILSGNAAPAGAGLPSNPTLPSDSAHLTWSVAVSGNDFVVTATRSQGFNNLANSNLAKAVGEHLEQIGTNNLTSQAQILLNAVENKIDNGLDLALEELAPESYQTILPSLADNNQSLDVIELRLAKLRQIKDNQPTGMAAGDDIPTSSNYWLRPFGSYTRQKAIGNIKGYHADLYGIAAGFDTQLSNSNLTVGSAFSFSTSKLTSTRTKTNIKNYQLTVYSEYNIDHDFYPNIFNNAFVNLLLTAAYNDYNNKRNINIGTFIREAKSAYDGQYYSFKMLAGKSYKICKNYTKNLKFSPLLSMQYAYLNQNSYTETNADAANLHVKPKAVHVLEFAIGGKLYVPIDPKAELSKMTPYLQAMFNYDIFAKQQRATTNFTIFGPSFQVNGIKPGNITYKLSAGLETNFTKHFQADFNYSFAKRSKNFNHAVYLNLKYKI